MTPENKRIPCTKRIAGELEQKIRDGILRTGTKLPSVRELAETYHTCTSVCLSVYRALEKKQLVQREPGRGTAHPDVSHGAANGIREKALPDPRSPSGRWGYPW